MDSENQITQPTKKEQDIIYSRAIKAGKRIYYLDVKLNRKNEKFLSITESTKRVIGTQDDAQVTFEKHKIFLYNEDFDKFVDGLNDVMNFIRTGQVNVVESGANPQSSLAVEVETKGEGEPIEEVKKTKSFLDKFRF